MYVREYVSFEAMGNSRDGEVKTPPLNKDEHSSFARNQPSETSWPVRSAAATQSETGRSHNSAMIFWIESYLF